ncbi:MAG: GspH/FimT family pseudopilin [Candidatus Omnitrophota bacterium]
MHKGFRGLTFIEILMVVVILGIFVAMGTPRFRTTYIRLQLSNQARSLAKLLTYAQFRAVTEGRRYCFQTDSARRRYWLTAEEEDGKPTFVRIQGRYGRAVSIPAGISLQSQEELFYFYPDGSTDSLALSLKHSQGGELILKKGKSFGHIRIEEAQPLP